MRQKIFSLQSCASSYMDLCVYHVDMDWCDEQKYKERLFVIVFYRLIQSENLCTVSEEASRKTEVASVTYLDYI